MEYTFGYVLDSEGKVRINLHHSSVLSTAGISETQVLAAQKSTLLEALATQQACFIEMINNQRQEFEVMMNSVKTQVALPVAEHPEEQPCQIRIESNVEGAPPIC